MVGRLLWTGGSAHRGLRCEACGANPPLEDLGGYLPIFNGGQGRGDPDQAETDSGDVELPPIGDLDGGWGLTARPPPIPDYTLREPVEFFCNCGVDFFENIGQDHAEWCDSRLLADVGDDFDDLDEMLRFYGFI